MKGREFEFFSELYKLGFHKIHPSKVNLTIISFLGKGMLALGIHKLMLEIYKVGLTDSPWGQNQHLKQWSPSLNL